MNLQLSSKYVAKVDILVDVKVASDVNLNGDTPIYKVRPEVVFIIIHDRYHI